jgi:hypothetical protein
MEKLAVFKLVDDVPMICGYFNSKDDAIRYLTEVGKMINQNMQHQLAGEYIVVPTLYFNLQVQSVNK